VAALVLDDVFIDQRASEAHKIDGRRADEKYGLTMGQSQCGMEPGQERGQAG
jgi:hypothetical protein